MATIFDNALTLAGHFEVTYADHYKRNDPAHRLDHIRGVCHEALRINAALKLGLPELLIVAAAYSHDIMAYDRENHHHLGYEWVMTVDDRYFNAIKSADRQMIADAVLTHRASSKTTEYPSVLAELIATADRGAPDFKMILSRAIAYRHDLPYQLAYPSAIAHIKEKFGSAGYCKYPAMYHRVYGESLVAMQRQIDAL